MDDLYWTINHMPRKDLTQLEGALKCISFRRSKRQSSKTSLRTWHQLTFKSKKALNLVYVTIASELVSRND